MFGGYTLLITQTEAGERLTSELAEIRQQVPELEKTGAEGNMAGGELGQLREHAEGWAHQRTGEPTKPATLFGYCGTGSLRARAWS